MLLNRVTGEGTFKYNSDCSRHNQQDRCDRGKENMRLSVEYVVPKYQTNLYQAAFAILQDVADAQDAVQMVFIKYHRLDLDYENEDHIRRWLFRSALNQAKDIRRSFWRKNRTELTDGIHQTAALYQDPLDRHLFESVSRLPEKYRVMLQLFYYEEFSIREIAEVTALSEAAVKKRLSRGREMLREMLEKEGSGDV